MAYTVEEILIDGIAVMYLSELEMICRPGEHSVLRLKGNAEADEGEALVYNLREYAPISVKIKEGSASKILFSGFVTSAKVAIEGQCEYIQVEAKSVSLLMDLKKKSRSFQNVSMTYDQLAGEILKDYPGSDIKLCVPDEALGKISVQYRETDWEFLKRMFSMLRAKLSCIPDSEQIHLYGGIPEGIQEKRIYTRLMASKEMGEYNYWQQEGVNAGDIDFLVYTIKTEELIELFEPIQIQGQSFVVRSICYFLEKGVLYGRCELQRKAGLIERKQYPMHMIGAALEGEIIEVKGEQVKIHLSIDDDGSQDVYWFPFSTLSASPDGSGWYYMPETGDQVRVYFPSKFTEDVIAISAVSLYDGKSGDGPDKMGTPSTKSLGNPHGQEMSMGEDGICLKCKGGAASLTIGNDGKIAIQAQKQISIIAENDIDITSETDMVFHGAQNVAIVCTEGGKLVLSDDGNLYLSGTEVLVD